ncbi:MAG: HAD family hydrolase [Candidatus Bathyarchaeota archaeon]|nr:HAD family hydrolase [Candidatus Bathyarchaeota archaeon]MDH5623260.1 HAD family hydrolase [Candidatus Bathyarchaeota archaeon]MDH5635664.1 HAD family hydrolase [Candidatus Bathyarchaeota archaeon]MDH5701583.1 HAD family hydrolase [Candidatus Bathyarchaeota archaeon]
MARIKVISFDLDGTLFDNMFVDSVWLEEIPRLYSLKKGVSVENAKKTVKREYDMVGKDRLEWYDIHYWIRKFGLNVEAKELLRNFEHRIKAYPEVPKVLEQLKQRGFRLVVVTNAIREFVELELEKANMKDFFDRVFSSTSDFGVVKKTVKLYKRVCSILRVSPHEMIHIGDDRNFDFDVPRRLGIPAFHLDRTGKHVGEFVIHSLEELNRKLEKAEDENL